MANTFKNATSQNVTTLATVYTCPASTTAIVIQFDIGNTTTSAVSVDAKINDSSAVLETFIVDGAPIPVGSALNVSDGKKIVLEASDTLRVASTGNVDVTISVLEMT